MTLSNKTKCLGNLTFSHKFYMEADQDSNPTSTLPSASVILRTKLN